MDGKDSPNGNLSWYRGKLFNHGLLSGPLDTNGIRQNLMTFPADFTHSNATSRNSSGYTLQHEVQGFVFDTLLASCHYGAIADEGDRCDFLTPDGYLVYSSVENCFCFLSSYRRLPDPQVFSALGGRPVQTAVIRPWRGANAIGSRPTDGFNLLGQRMGKARRPILSIPGGS